MGSQRKTLYLNTLCPFYISTQANENNHVREPGLGGGGGILIPPPEALKLDCPGGAIGSGGPPGTLPPKDATGPGALKLGGPDDAIGGGGPGGPLLTNDGTGPGGCVPNEAGDPDIPAATAGGPTAGGAAKRPGGGGKLPGCC